MITAIVVSVTCDRCGMGFTVHADMEAFRAFASVHAYAEDAIRGSLDYQDEYHAPGRSSVREGRHLCNECTAEKGTI